MTALYHLQILKWLTHHKISFGLSNLAIRLGFNSSWHSLVALLDINIYHFNAAEFSFLINLISNKKIENGNWKFSSKC